MAFHFTKMLSFFRLLISLAVLGSCAAFQYARSRSRPPSSILQMAVIQPENWAGQSAPFGYFDPLGFSTWLADDDYKDVKRYRESELKHGRIAMMAAIAIPISEVYHPFYPQLSGPAIYHFQQMSDNYIPNFWIVPALWTAYFEIISIAKGWEPGAKGWSTLQDTYIPGDLDFDPLGLKPDTSSDFNKVSKDFRVRRTKELNNGRLAMLAVAGMVAQELVDGLPIIEHLTKYGLSRGV